MLEPSIAITVAQVYGRFTGIPGVTVLRRQALCFVGSEERFL